MSAILFTPLTEATQNVDAPLPCPYGAGHCPWASQDTHLHAALDNANGNGVAREAGGIRDTELGHNTLMEGVHSLDADVQGIRVNADVPTRKVAKARSAKA